ncbi:NlpC/P60 family protein [Kordiimonas pumila]|uniref:NlpC/P60 family protein n=1 Tax=Kordiimonas pumila TaxID=2161677 RepID=A0ABV7D5U5_9PROT|nr:NlpC/P60 family protein [Kordiimonas pumila]
MNEKDFGLPPLYDPQSEIAQQNNLMDAQVITAQVSVPTAPLHETPDTDSQALTYVLLGEPLYCTETKGSWQKVVSIIDGYSGWIDTAFVNTAPTAPTHRIIVPLSHIYTLAHLKSQPLNILPMGAFVTVAGQPENGFMPLLGGGWVFAKHLYPIGTEAIDPLAAAESFIATPYLWGGRSYMGIDCSGLVQIALAASGKRIHRDSGPQFRSLGRPLSKDEAPARGDLAFFPGHVGWMIDGIHLLHANATHMAVTIDTVADVTSWVAAQTDKPPFSGYKRLSE